MSTDGQVHSNINLELCWENTEQNQNENQFTLANFGISDGLMENWI